MILILFMALFLSFSRGAWGAMLFGLGVYWALGLHRQTWWRLSLVILAAVVLAVIVIVVILQTQALSGFLESRLQLATYDSLRFARQLEGLQIGLTNILGQGPGRLGRAHSLYAREFAGLGILGLVTISGFLFASSGSMVVLARRDNTPVWGLSPAVLAASLLAVMFQSFVIDTIHWRHFWLLLALAAVVHRAGATSGSIENAA
jgi:hypothetical protein